MHLNTTPDPPPQKPCIRDLHELLRDYLPVSLVKFTSLKERGAAAKSRPSTRASAKKRRWCWRGSAAATPASRACFKSLSLLTPFPSMPEHMTRAEHPQWAKDRALAYVEAGNFPSACASSLSDLGKHPQIDPSAARTVRAIEAVTGGLSTADQVRRSSPASTSAMAKLLTFPRVSLTDAATGKRVRISWLEPSAALVPVPTPGPS